MVKNTRSSGLELLKGRKSEHEKNPRLTSRKAVKYTLGRNGQLQSFFLSPVTWKENIGRSDQPGLIGIIENLSACAQTDGYLFYGP
jgi:hypothetical protein